MLTILEAIKLSTEFLQKHNIPEPRINAEYLLADILKCKRLELYLSYNKPLNEGEKELYRLYIKKRSNSEPLQYILGYTEFFNLKFQVNENVLIPRQETELLVEEVLKFVKGGEKVLDIGTGSGAIAISLKYSEPLIEVAATDSSREALKVAYSNAVNILQDKKAIKFVHHNILNEDLQILGKFDFIVSNPPYVTLDQYNSIQPEVKFEPKYAVTDENDGMTFYNFIIEKSPILLNPNGRLFFEIGEEMHEKVVEQMKSLFTDISVINDYSNIPRIISGRLK
ncbi:MAG: peptide chain release factor N(5)-glutamine methyltransferase [Melioribacteraceae bacterium]|nr:peptide chain release factor N(5)-glutamine methyltransferase [Melioribacteraceae bacterium]MDD3558655.1 peptide chain release factor N(5)-glutamine methyltransferase [Melioribacteraceae bacterium]